MYYLSHATILQVYGPISQGLELVMAQSQALSGMCKLLEVVYFLGAASFIGMSQATFSRMLILVYYSHQNVDNRA